MNTLVIGASGLLGSALVHALERAGIQVHGTYHSQPTIDGESLDLTDEHAVRECLTALRPEVIFLPTNTKGGVDYCEDHPGAARALIVDGTRHVLASAPTGARVVFYSSDYVFDGRGGPYTEDAPPSPINEYGRAKLDGENLVRAAGRHIIIRTTAVFGWNGRSRNFAMQVWKRLQTGGPLPVPDDQWCNPTLAEYLAEASVRLVQMEFHGTVNVAGRDRMARSTLGERLARAMALDPRLLEPVPTSALKQRALRPLDAGLRTDTLESLLGTATMGLDEALKRFRRQWRAETHVTRQVTSATQESEILKEEILDRVKRYYEVVHRPKPFVPHESRLPYAGRVFGGEEMVNLVDSALDFWLTLGPYGDVFEEKMRRFLGVRDFVLMNSGSTANLAAVMTLMSKQMPEPLVAGDEVITPAVTFPTTLAPLVHGGLVPVFVDSEVGTYNINPNLVEGALSPRTRAIFVPHTLGNPCDLDILADVAARHGLYLIEDCCDALGATWRDRMVGTFGDLATLSFFPAHHITMGEGGAVMVNRAKLGRIVRSVRDWGRDCWCATGESNTCGRRFGWQLGGLPAGYDHKYIYSNLGYNFKPTDLQAAIGVAQADRIPDFIAARRRNFTRLADGLERYRDWLILPTLDPRSNPSWFGLPLTVHNGVSRRRLVQWLETAKIETRQVFGGNILQQPGYRDITCRIHGELTHTDRIMRDTLFIGVYPGLTDPMIDFILQAFDRFFAQQDFIG
ncbi:MAG TPA: lipopolysaccharide biosynthesis protein RfbH [Vicinamibacterales bacterium]|nr:lipopolysaccharide biosynthesis protein RfbH [Vicinamibacterales bacterium]